MMYRLCCKVVKKNRINGKQVWWMSKSKELEERILKMESGVGIEEVRECGHLFLEKEDSGEVEHLRQSVEDMLLRHIGSVDTPGSVVDYLLFNNTLLYTHPSLLLQLSHQLSYIPLQHYSFDQLSCVVHQYSFHPPLDHLMPLLNHYSALLAQCPPSTPYSIDNLYNYFVAKYGYQALLQALPPLIYDPLLTSLLPLLTPPTNTQAILKYVHLLLAAGQYTQANQQLSQLTQPQQLTCQGLLEVILLNQKEYKQEQEYKQKEYKQEQQSIVQQLNPQVLQLIQSRLHLMNVNQLAVLVKHLSDCGMEIESELSVEIEQQVVEQIDQLNASDLVMLAVGMLQSGRDKFYLMLEHHLLQHLSTFTPQQLTLILFSFHKRQLVTLSFFRLLEKHLITEDLSIWPLEIQLMLQSSVFPYLTTDSALLPTLHQFHQQTLLSLSTLSNHQLLSFLHTLTLFQDITTQQLTLILSQLHTRLQQIQSPYQLQMYIDFVKNNQIFNTDEIRLELLEKIKQHKSSCSEIEKQNIYNNMKEVQNSTPELLSLIFA